VGSEELVHRPGSIIAHIIEDVGIPSKGHRRVGVAKRPGDRVKRNFLPPGQCQRCDASRESGPLSGGQPSQGIAGGSASRSRAGGSCRRSSPASDRSGCRAWRGSHNARPYADARRCPNDWEYFLALPTRGMVARGAKRRYKALRTNALLYSRRYLKGRILRTSANRVSRKSTSSIAPVLQLWESLAAIGCLRVLSGTSLTSP
jgi:hypothetical protein